MTIDMIRDRLEEIKKHPLFREYALCQKFISEWEQYSSQQKKLVEPPHGLAVYSEQQLELLPKEVTRPPKPFWRKGTHIQPFFLQALAIKGSLTWTNLMHEVMANTGAPWSTVKQAFNRMRKEGLISEKGEAGDAVVTLTILGEAQLRNRS